MVKITIAETQPVFAEGIIKMLSHSAGLHLNRLTTSYPELLQTLKTNATDLLLLDAELNTTLTEERLICQIKKEFPRLKIVLFSKNLSVGFLPRLRRAGLEAYLSKNITCQELKKAIFTVLGGSGYLQESLSVALNSFNAEIDSISKIEDRRLTKREQQILGLIVEEYTNQEIAEELFISIPTVETHRKNLILKMGVRNTAGLVREAILRRCYLGFFMENHEKNKTMVFGEE
ncbi:LuxR C-terminal-related transcriptional regulator [Haliscomenobacter hydrossis]|uniref:Two component transcriptional regulator, LuxR family n=1 Tax=Haliscomenobacter hydrossis (strain ATCC 27775 / DSM 1100 / LMG 10767 / O) TaxID=760192 RepID=F4L0I0_HALH1|nr:response regulator transcription factor [Haliscomenobacter hydrossis]AEE48492.1 two component transcriptional regulator, LuxR family [Haliscomenobacter hydrossis DSM 1100]